MVLWHDPGFADENNKNYHNGHYTCSHSPQLSQQLWLLSTCSSFVLKYEIYFTSIHPFMDSTSRQVGCFLAGFYLVQNLNGFFATSYHNTDQGRLLEVYSKSTLLKCNIVKVQSFTRHLTLWVPRA